MFRSISVPIILSVFILGRLVSAQSPTPEAPSAPTPTPAAPAPTPAPVPAPASSAPVVPTPPSIAKDHPLNITVKSIDGKDANLAAYAGQVVVIVNVASRCGFTKQYAGLEELYKSRKDDGLVVLGFPANNFGGQEPGTDAEIASFCSTNFGVTFPMFSKVSVKGSNQHPLFTRLSKDGGGDPDWNFTKYVIDRSGKVVARFGPRVAPDDKAFVAKLDELLAAKAPSVPPAPPTAAQPPAPPPAR
ncbi:MAG: glutathione peroxidase [Phycisphaerales bacterium]